MTPAALISDIDATYPKVLVGNAAGTCHQSSTLGNLLLARLPTRNANIMPSFQHNLVGVRKKSDHGCKVLFGKTAVNVFSKNSSILLKGWRESNVPKLWRLSLLPKEDPARPVLPPEFGNAPAALNVHDLPSVSALVCYLHANAGFPVKATWLASIKAGN